MLKPATGRLDGYGWAPGDLERVCSGVQHVAALSGPERVTEEQAEARAALLDEAFIYYSNGLSAAPYNPTGYIVRLPDLGWTHGGIGRHVRFAKQRVQKLIKTGEERMRDHSGDKPQTVVFDHAVRGASADADTPTRP
ncbi:hypothetical protein [Nesterenkonia haasae]|uniref:hypothetical protein n=1 Tax=Nesterenkonia haasae TaxID=2587813 RepID=UPI0013914E41|nr:hypothetical protein [Nesterenkonia haasae]NDK32384.1 hypothetical protein [Nesterenkonia haasae]